MNQFPFASLITLLVVSLMFWTAINVGRARAKYGIQVPATTGHDVFERIYRVQMNTLEAAALMLPALWVYATTIGDRGAALAGLIWLAGRLWYAMAYPKDPAKRGGGFGVATLPLAGLWLGGLWGVIRTL